MLINSEVYETNEFKKLIGITDTKKRLVATYCYFIDLDTLQLEKINAAIDKEKKDHENSNSEIRYIVSNKINKMYAVLDHIDKEKLQTKQLINSSITQDEYRKLIRGIL